MHLIHSLNQVSESVINVSRERFVVVRLRVAHVIILIRDMNRIESCRSLPPNVGPGVLEVSFKRGVRECVGGRSSVVCGRSRMARRNGPNADGTMWSELESVNKKLGGERNLVGAIASV